MNQQLSIKDRGDTSIYSVPPQKYQKVCSKAFIGRGYLYTFDSKNNDYDMSNFKCNVFISNKYRDLYRRKLIEKQNKSKIKNYTIPINLTITLDGISGIQ